MLKLRASTRRSKVRLGVVVHVLKNNGHNVVADVTLSLQLLFRVFDIGKKSRHVKHDLMTLVDRIDRVVTSCVGFNLVNSLYKYYNKKQSESLDVSAFIVKTRERVSNPIQFHIVYVFQDLCHCCCYRKLIDVS